MSRPDWIALVIVALFALSGLRRGLIGTVLSLGGLVAGAIIGARLAPHFLNDGSLSPYTPAAALVGALIGAALLQSVAAIAGSFARGGLHVLPPLRMLDTFGGLLAGAALGLALVWVVGATLLQIPGQPKLRDEVRDSAILQRLNEIVPPRNILRAFARIDPFPSISGPAPPSTPPDTRALAEVSRIRPSVVRITAVACGLGVEGSGWVVRPHLVVTAAHVIEGGSSIRADRHAARAVVVNRKQDIAILRVPGLDAPALPFIDARPGDSVAIVGYPENGPFDARPGRIGSTADVLVNGNLRQVTAINGLVRHGNSGGPAVNIEGKVESTVFAARIGARAGYGVPAAAVRAALLRAGKAVSTGKC
ncbi:MAG TPA: CvpA family protein [Gaiellaceae bacterium]|jgi:uncharacterized membrane protein required for colicin V production|nr:CvpA family protein [Gaiellaceae bacterium]